MLDNFNFTMIEEVKEELQSIIDIEESNPILKEELCVSILKRTSPTSWISCYNRFNFKSYEQAYEYFKLGKYKITIISEEKNNRKFIAENDKEYFRICEFIYKKYVDKDRNYIDFKNYSKNTLNKFKETIDFLEKFHICLNHIKDLVEGDISEENFLINLNKELREYEKHRRKNKRFRLLE